jgi:hypothetical protein
MKTSAVCTRFSVLLQGQVISMKDVINRKYFCRKSSGSELGVNGRIIIKWILKYEVRENIIQLSGEFW